ncbi:MAG TPA: hypothetical protein PKE15_04975 [Ottowia sp.]|nr:hypothetical protein [Ottowia sp.]
MSKSKTDQPAASQPAPAQWQAKSAGLSMCLDATDAGRLVRLADVALWLIEFKGLPRIPAVERLADELGAAKPAPALFLAQPGQYARPVEDAAARFGYHTAESWAAQGGRPTGGRYVISPGIRASDAWANEFARTGFERRELFGALVPIPPRAPAPERPPEFVEPGIPALLRLLRKRWTFTRWGRRTDAEIFAAPQLPGFAVAVRVADAARIWGWGAATDQAPAPVELNTYADVVKHHRANQGALWDVPPGQYDLLRAEEKRANDAGEMGVRARMAKDFGVSVRRIGQLLAKIKSGSRATQRTRAQKVQPLPGLKAV